MSLSPVSDKDYQAFDLLAQDEVQFMWPKELKSPFWIHKDILPVCSVQWRLGHPKFVFGSLHKISEPFTVTSGFYSKCFFYQFCCHKRMLEFYFPNGSEPVSHVCNDALHTLQRRQGRFKRSAIHVKILTKTFTQHLALPECLSKASLKKKEFNWISRLLLLSRVYAPQLRTRCAKTKHLAHTTT